MASKKASCPKCGRDLGNKRTDLENQYTINISCPNTKCGAKLSITYGKGELSVRVVK